MSIVLIHFGIMHNFLYQNLCHFVLKNMPKSIDI
nr:MAG TPA: hypothetical protein [Caudoviricetes sp.]